MDNTDSEPASLEVAEALEQYNKLALVIREAVAVALPARNISPLVRGVYLMGPEPSFGTMGRARLMKALQRAVGNLRLGQALGQMKVYPQGGQGEFTAELVAQFRAAAQLQIEQLRAETEMARAAVVQAGQAQAEAIRRLVDQNRLTLQQQIAQAQAQVEAAAKANQQRLGGFSHHVYGAVSDEAGQQVRTIKAEAARQQKIAGETVEVYQQELSQFGAGESQRGLAAVSQQAQQARRWGQAKAKGYDWSSRQGRAQARAVLAVAQEVAAILAQPGPNLQQVAAPGADLVRLEGEISQRIESRLVQVLEQCEAGLRACQEELKRLVVSSQLQFEQLAAESNGFLRQTEAKAKAQLRQLEEKWLGPMLNSVTQAQARLNQKLEVSLAEMSQVVDTMAADIAQLERPDIKDIEQAIEQGQTRIQLIAEQGRTELAEEREAVMRELAGAVTEAEHEVAGITGAAVKTIEVKSTASGQRSTAVMNAAQGRAGQSGTACINRMVKTNGATTQYFKELVAGMQPQLDTELRKGKDEITLQINQIIQQNRESLAFLAAKMEAAAKIAAEKYALPPRNLREKLTGYLIIFFDPSRGDS